MNQLLNDEKHIILTKREYDELEKTAKEKIDSYEGKIKELLEVIEKVTEGKPYISQNIPKSWRYGEPYCFSFVKDSNDATVVKLFNSKRKEEIDELNRKYNKQIKKMSFFKFLKIKWKAYKDPYYQEYYFGETDDL